MNRHDIITLPHESLRKPSVLVPLDRKKLATLVSDMNQAIMDWDKHRPHEITVALAAVQINKLYRVIMLRKDYKNKKDNEFEVLLNPEIVRRDGVPIVDLEGCLSVTSMYGNVARYPRVKVKALDIEGRQVKKVVKGFRARVLQHEIDHTNGIMIVDRCGKQGTYFQLKGDGTMHKITASEKAAFLDKVGLKKPSDE